MVVGGCIGLGHVVALEAKKRSQWSFIASFSLGKPVNQPYRHLKLILPFLNLKTYIVALDSLIFFITTIGVLVSYMQA